MLNKYAIDLGLVAFFCLCFGSGIGFGFSSLGLGFFWTLVPFGVIGIIFTDGYFRNEI